MKARYSAPIALGLIVSMIWTPCLLNATPPAQQTTATPATASSDVVTTAATVNLVALLNKLQNGTAQAADARGARVAAATLFAQMQQTGANDQITAQMLAQGDSFVNDGISEEQIQQQIHSATAMGAQINPNKFQNLLSSTPQQRQAMLANLQKNGIWGMEQQFLSSLQTLESTLQSKGSTPTSAGLRLPSAYHYGGGSLRLLAFERNGGPQAHLLRVDCALMAELCFAAAALGAEPFFIVGLVYAAEAAAGLC